MLSVRSQVRSETFRFLRGIGLNSECGGQLMVCIVHAAGKLAQQSMVAESHGSRVHVGQGMRINFNSPVAFRKEALLGHERCANSEQTSFFGS